MLLLHLEVGIPLHITPSSKKIREEKGIPSRENRMCIEAIWAGDSSGEGLGSAQGEPQMPWSDPDFLLESRGAIEGV